jgi:tryptophanyl-tRNA synthetase
MSQPRKRCLTGIRATGQLHLGNLVGAVQPALSYQSDYDCFFFIADLHALTSNHDGALVASYSLDVAAHWIALGMDIKHHCLYRQSDLPWTAEFAWYLSCVTGLGLLLKGHSYKDGEAKGTDLNHGVLAYPVLMAADIIMYDADIVPVGKDQKQHVEMARDMAGSFNATYRGEFLKLPQPILQEETMSIPGLDGRKMSKSYDNGIPIFADEKTLRKLCLSIKTDSTPLEAPKELKGSLVGDLFSVVATSSQFEDLSARLAKGGMGWGHAKEELFVAIRDKMAEPRKHYQELMNDQATLLQHLEEGADRAAAVARPVLDRVRLAVGLGPHRL